MTKSEKGIALVTGASTGIGAVYADRLAKRGYDLILVARDLGRLEALADRLIAETGRTVEVIGADLTDPSALARIAEGIEHEARLTLLVNNAGMSLDGGLLENDAATLSRIIALNVTAPTLLASAAARTFLAAGRGAIINLSSVLALAPEMFDGVYSGTKAYLLNLSQSMAAQLEDKGVRVQVVLPGATRTEIWERSGKDLSTFPDDFVMEVDDLVDAALVGFDRGETVTIPPLQDEGQWLALQETRLLLAPNLSKSRPAPRYRAVAG